MDVNNTRFHLILRKDEWESSSDGAFHEGLSWDDTCGGFRLTPHLFRFPDTDSDPVLEPKDRRGADVDQYGNWYWISDDRGEIRVLSLKGGASDHFWDGRDRVQECPIDTKDGAFRPIKSKAEPLPLFFSGLAVTAYHYLVVGVVEPAGLLIFDLHAGGTPTQLLWPEAVPFQPFDMSAAPDGGVWILDSANQQTWKLDRYFRLENNGKPFSIDAENAVSIDAAPDGSVFIMDSPPGDTVPPAAYSTLYWCRFDTGDGSIDCVSLSLEVPFSNNEMIDFSSPPPTLRGHDMAFVPESPEEITCTRVPSEKGLKILKGTLFIAEVAGNQTYAFTLRAGGEGANPLSLELKPLYYPMRLYRGRALVADGDTVYYDMGERWLPLTAMPRPRFRETGYVILPVFDGKEPGCVWHRLFIEAYIPSGTAAAVSCYATDIDETPTDADWERRPQPSLYCRGDGAELPYFNPFAGEENPPDGLGTWELLFQELKGRYLHIRLNVSGPGNRTPYLYALRAYYPRFSYLKEYLPAVYREDEISASFLERFLANVEGFYTVMEGRIAEVQSLFDVDIVSEEYLEWLAQWFGFTLDPAWGQSRRRLFLRHAARLFKQRGTPAGIIRMIRIAIDPCPGDELFDECVGEGGCGAGAGRAVGFSVRIVESFLTRSGEPHRFTVLVPMSPGMDIESREQRLEQVKRIMEIEKPAHTYCEVEPYWALFRVGEARLGYETLPGEGSRFTALVLGRHALAESYLSAPHPWDVEDRWLVGRESVEK